MGGSSIPKLGRNLRPTRLYQIVQRSLRIPNDFASKEVPPVWFKTVERYPPAEILTRPKPTVHQDDNPRQRRPRHIFRPQTISFPEDTLRRTFFKDHPWELARPRIAVELDGKDARYVDWSRGLRQPGIIVSGESVVQRQLWLMENHTIPQYVLNEATGDTEVINVPITREQAYDMVRKEFYAIRQQQQIQRRIAEEEARMVGAYFGKSRLEVGMEIEDKIFDQWKAWAVEQNAKVSADRASAYANYSTEDDSKVAADLAVLNAEDEYGAEQQSQGETAAVPAKPAQSGFRQ